MRPLLLCIAMDPARLMRISMTAMAQGIAVKEVKETQWGQTLGALCGLEPVKQTAAKARVGAEMMVMAFFSDIQIDDFLSAIRKNGMEPARLKAVLTATNRAWDCGKMYAEMMLEDAALRGNKK